MSIVAEIVADPKRFGVGVEEVSAVEPGAEDTVPIENTLGKIRSLQGKIQEVEVQGMQLPPTRNSAARDWVGLQQRSEANLGWAAVLCCVFERC